MYYETSRRLKEALERKGYTQQDLADMSGVNKASVSQYVNGSHAPGNISAMKMSKVLGVAPEWLMGFGEIPYLQAEYSTDNASLVGKIRNDRELSEVLPLYFSLPESKKKYVIETIKMLSN